MIKPCSDNIARGHLVPIRNGSRAHQLIMKSKWVWRRAQNPFNRQSIRCNTTYRKIHEHLLWWLEKKLIDFDCTKFYRIVLMVGHDRIKENCDYVLIYDPIKKPVKQETEHQICLDCDELIMMHRNGHRHCADCEEDDCVNNQYPYNPEPDNEEEQS